MRSNWHVTPTTLTAAVPVRRSAQTMGVALRGEEMKSVVAGKVDVPSLPGPRPSVAVIGAGAAGLAAGRILRDEGLRVTIFEKSPDVGGVWRYKPEPEARAPMCESM